MNLIPIAFGLSLVIFAGNIEGFPLSEGGDVNIWNATNVTITDYPYVASVTLDDMYLGAGVILNQHWILTAAFNCFEIQHQMLTLRVGSNYTDRGGQELRVDKVVVPAKFKRTWDYDIGLVKVLPKIEFNENVKSIALGNKNLKVGQKGVLAGWGPYDGHYVPSVDLQVTNITVTVPSRCERVYKGVYVGQRMICTYDKHTGPADLEDAGDPLVIDGKLYGLYAGANDGYPIERPTLYTKVQFYSSWIKKTIKT